MMDEKSKNTPSPANHAGYTSWLREIKEKIRSVQVKAALAASRELILFYWELGEDISQKLSETHWGSKIIDQLSKDLRSEFPDIQGFSRTNIYYIKKFYEYFITFSEQEQIIPPPGGQMDSVLTHQYGSQSYPPIIPQIGGQLPWSHIKILLDKVSDHQETLFYIRETIENGWSRDVLALQIKSSLYQRQGKSVSNFQQTLPTPKSDLAQQTIKDPYIFDFLSMTKPYNERDIENQLVGHITKFLLELGKGFAFIGRQYHLEVGESDYYLDLLFYHIKLKCYVVIELKNTKFIPEYAGKLNFYLSAVDSLLKAEDDKPTIGMLLCRDKNKIETEFALRDMNKPMGVSEFTLTEILPDELKGSLPTVEEIEEDMKQLRTE
ncbi:putative nuclease of restriction endonuclease-like (RecB) superfamily [Desulfobotulus alkaliphilus]|uniref:Putative nuclease of restriction endonuclease-like (RecB) superfamily n=1 Tax=Desulfobotulus alkaliphilus TaxID=622671 RepID=A0A562QZI5_9BACT|nr:PDDEXK nuclease domain-containing protein [Desulfobotulus alkaliphilus]TWI61754.1 putative nuclease of restriction endonuclease-like (RecB) superfamily [Desulfobotulus alkaliphilus]